MKDFKTQYGPWALVTGASYGFGAEFARQLSREKLNLVLVARSKERLENLSREIRHQNEIEVKIVVADLTQKEGVESVLKQTEEIEIGLLINNIGRVDNGYFLDSNIDRALETLDLNCRVPLELTHAFGRRMAERKRGGIMFLGSIVGFQGVPYIAGYAATKAYDLILAEGLAGELKEHNIDVLTLCPGFSKTNMALDLNFKGLPIQPMDVEPIVKDAINGLGKKSVVIPGFMNKFLYLLGKFFQSRRINTYSFGRVFRFVLREKLKS